MATGRRINHVVILMLENRSFDHYFGFSKPAPGQKCENLLGPNSNLFNLLDPSRPKSSSNPSFQVKKPAPFRGTRQGRSVAFIQFRMRPALQQ
jgi:phospholipase C